MIERTAKARVLVVDDAPRVRDALRTVLSAKGYVVRECADGQEALELLADWQPDLILLELMMPRLDGWDFRRQQLDSTNGIANIPTVIMSASPQLSELQGPLQPTAVLPKPFDLEQLMSTVERLVGQD